MPFHYRSPQSSHCACEQFLVLRIANRFQTASRQIISILFFHIAVAVVTIFFLAIPAYAAIDFQGGAAGIPGEDGTTGDPGANGTDGGPGDDASASAITSGTDNSNVANATGGDGAQGGAGGDGVDGIDADSNAGGGDGGAGGSGGNASATANTTITEIGIDASATAGSTGGNGGAGGNGGQAFAMGAAGQDNDGGNGGNAVGNSTAEAAGAAQANVTVVAGSGGNTRDGIAGDGGTAEITTGFATSSGSGSVLVNADAVGGNGGNATGAGDSGNGANTTVADVLTVETAGDATIDLFVRAGDAGSANSGQVGNAGNAIGQSNQAGSFLSLTIDLRIIGGNGGDRVYDSGSASDGGTATAGGTASNDAGSATANAWADGGQGGRGLSDNPASQGANSGSGGTANAMATAEANGTGSAARADAYAKGGNGGEISANQAARAGVGGNASAVALATGTGQATALADAEAVGGSGGSVRGFPVGATGYGGTGGNANAVATALNNDNQSAAAFARATGGYGGRGSGAFSSGDGGLATASASASSTAGGFINVQAKAIGGRGADGFLGANAGNGGAVSLIDSVGGSTSGIINLNQVATGGRGGESTGGVAGTGGNATSSLGFTSTSAQPMTVLIEATGGRGGVGRDGSAGGRGGDANADADITGNGDISLGVRLYPGEGAFSYDGDAGDAGRITVAPNSIVGRSLNAGDVSVTLNVSAAAGGAAFGARTGGDGSSVSALNAVNGFTDGGALTLAQSLNGGRTQSVEFATPKSTGAAGSPGSVLSQITKSGQFSALKIINNASGGDASWRENETAGPVDGGAAEAFSSATNSGGSVESYATARGGRAGRTSTGSMANGGDAIAHAFGFGTENAARVEVRATATGGQPASGTNGGILGNGTAEAVASGAGNAFSISSADSSGNVANSVSRASNSGIENAQAGASAFGSRGTARSEVIVEAGSGLAGVELRGVQPISEMEGSAVATATKAGGLARTVVRATFNTNVRFDGSLSGQSNASDGVVKLARASSFAPLDPGTATGARIKTDASVGYSEVWLTPDDIAYRGLSSLAVAFGMPSETTIDAPLVGDWRVRNKWNEDSHQSLLLGVMGGGSLNGTSINVAATQTFTSVLDLVIDTSDFVGDFEIWLGLTDTAVGFRGDGFDLLRFEIFKEGASVLDVSFVDLANALAFFDDNLISLGIINAGLAGDLDLQFRSSITSSTIGEGFYFDFVAGAFAVPVPPALWLFGSALGLLGWMRRKVA